MSVSAQHWLSPPRLPSTHYVDNRIYTDARILEEEQEKIFSRVWKLCCHESELPEPGDFRTAEIAGKPLIVIRGEDGAIRAFYNACPHRGSLLVRAPSGSAKTLTCIFHHWTFDTQGRCLRIFKPEAYENCGLDLADCGLRAVRTAVKHGMVFCNLDDGCESLDDYLGESGEYIKDVMGAAPLEVFHYHRAVLPTNWKLWAATNIEIYHVFLHVINRQTSVKAKGWSERRATSYPGAHFSVTPVKVAYENYRPQDRQWVDRDLTLPGMAPNEFRLTNYFPDVMVNIRTSTIRLDSLTPLAPDKVLVEFRGLGVRGESESDRRRRTIEHNQIWGPFGRNLPEDAVASVAQMRAMRERGSRYSIIARDEKAAPTMSDEPLRTYYTEWSRRMGRPAHNPFNDA